MTEQEAGRPGTRYASNSAIRIAYEDLGGAGGEPLLLVMGLGASRFWWPPGLIEGLVAGGFHVACYDQRDAGQSTHLPDGAARHPVVGLFARSSVYSAEDMTDDAATVLDALGWPTAHVFGHSMGGLLAQRFAIRHADRVTSLFSSAAVPSDAGRTTMLRYLRPSFLARASRLSMPDGPDGDLLFGVGMHRLLASPGFPFEQGIAQEAVQRELESLGRVGFGDQRAQARQIGAPWSGGRLADLRIPAFVLHGDRDQVLRPSAGRDTAAAIPHARFLRVPGLGHDLPRALWPSIVYELRHLVARSAAGVL